MMMRIAQYGACCRAMGGHGHHEHIGPERHHVGAEVSDEEQDALIIVLTTPVYITLWYTGV